MYFGEALPRHSSLLTMPTGIGCPLLYYLSKTGFFSAAVVPNVDRSKHTLLDINGLKSDRALYKVPVWHIAAKFSHETNLAITKLSLYLIHTTMCLGLPMFINATTRQQISIYSIGPYWYLLACTPTFGEVGYNFFSLAPLANPVLYPP